MPVDVGSSNLSVSETLSRVERQCSSGSLQMASYIRQSSLLLSSRLLGHEN